MEVGVKESSKKKLMRRKWSDHVNKSEKETGKETRYSESGVDKEARKTEIATGLQ